MKALLFAVLMGVPDAFIGQAVSQSLYSGENLSPGIIGTDDRALLSEKGPPWDAVGQVNVAGFRLLVACTGTLVAPNVVLTAAHCVVDPATAKPFPLASIHFLAGVRGSQYEGHAIAECLHFLTDYKYVPAVLVNPTLGNRTVGLEVFETDVVAIVLADKLRVDSAPLAVGVLSQPGLSLVHAAYPGDHRFLPWAQFNCRLLRSDLVGPLWFNDCDTHAGSSGGPLLTKMGDSYEVAAVMLGTSQGLFNVALPISVWLDLARKTSCP